MAGIPYLENYKNPCFYKELNINKTGQVVQCLPYFYVIGFQKSGTTTLYGILYRHPDFIPSNLEKELQWWGIIRFMKGDDYYSRIKNEKKLTSEYFRKRQHFFQDPSSGETSLGKYIQAFSDAAKKIEATEENYFHYKVTGDFSPSSTDGTDLKTADDIYWLTPSAKIIVIMRNPTHRLMSWYNEKNTYHISAKNKPLTPAQIHEDVKRKISVFRNCSERLKANETNNRYSCVTDRNFRSKSINDPALSRGCYVAYLERYLSVFPPEQMLVLRFEDMIKDVKATAQQVYKFLGLKAHSNPADIRANQSQKKMEILNSTRELIDEFYAPFNKDLVKLLGNEKWLWKE